MGTKQTLRQAANLRSNTRSKVAQYLVAVDNVVVHNNLILSVGFVVTTVVLVVPMSGYLVCTWPSTLAVKRSISEPGHHIPHKVDLVIIVYLA